MNVKALLKQNRIVGNVLKIRNRRRNIKYFKRLIKGGSALDLLGPGTKDHWKPRIELVQKSADNNRIVFNSEAGTFNNDFHFIMHNGLKIDPFSYYGVPMLELLFLNKGVHEPQEEFVFQEVLKDIPKKALMIELGSYWSFYSMWFNHSVSGARNYMIEPEHIESGKINFKLNRMNGDFTQAYVADKSEKPGGGIPTVSIDDYIHDENIDFVDILHSDIQGYEYKMLIGASKILQQKKVGYIFISTHSNELHHQCRDYLSSEGYIQVCSYNMDESYSWDGLLVYKNPSYRGIDTLEISRRSLA